MMTQMEWERTGDALDGTTGGRAPQDDGQLRIEVQQVDGYALLDLRGELDVATAPSLVTAAERALEEPCDRLLIACEHLTFVDSCGLRALLSIRAACAGIDTRVYLVRPNPQLEELLEMTQLRPLFH